MGSICENCPGKDEAVETVYFVDSPLDIIPDVTEQEKTRIGRFYPGNE